MTNEEIDQLWHKANEESIKTSGLMGDCRYVFAKMVSDRKVAECIKICEDWAEEIGEITSEGLAVQVCITTMKVKQNAQK